MMCVDGGSLVPCMSPSTAMSTSNLAGAPLGCSCEGSHPVAVAVGMLLMMCVDGGSLVAVYVTKRSNVYEQLCWCPIGVQLQGLASRRCRSSKACHRNFRHWLRSNRKRSRRERRGFFAQRMRRQERKPKRSIVSLHPNGWHKVNLMPHASEIERTWHTPNPAYPHVPGLFETPGGLVKPRSILVETGRGFSKTGASKGTRSSAGESHF